MMETEKDTHPGARQTGVAGAGVPGSGTRSAATRGAAGLARLREEIERVDRDLVDLLAERIRLARAIGEAKRAAGLPTLDPAREAAVVRRAAALAREAGLDTEDVRWVFWRLIGLSRRAQQREDRP